MPNRDGATLLALIESTEDLVWSVDTDFGLVAFNSAFRRTFEGSFGLHGAIGMRPQDFPPSCLPELWPPLYRRALEEGPFRAEFPLYDGRILELSFSPIVDDGKAMGVSVFGKDITKRKAAEKALRGAEEKYQSFFDDALEGVFQTTFAGQSLIVNPALARILGYDSPQECMSMVSDSARDVWADPEDRARFLRLLEEQGSVRRFECRFKRKDGSILWLSLYGRKSLSADGKTPCTEGFIEDITARKRTEEALAESESRFRAIFEGNASVMLIVEPGGAIVEANPAAAAYYGYARQQLIGMDIGRINALPAQELAAELQRALRKERTYFDFRHRLAGGELRDVEVYTSPVAIGGRALLLSIVHDITARKQAERELLETLESLNEAQKVGELGSYVLDIQTGPWTCSKAMDEIFGIGPGYVRDLAGWAALILPDDRAMMTGYLLDEVLGKRKDFDKQYRIVRQTDGETRWVHGRGRLEFDAQGQPVRLRGLIQDITEAKLAELRLRDSEERYRATFEQAAVGIVHTSLDGHFLRCNQRFAEILGYPREELLGMSFQQITATEDALASIAVLRDLVAGTTASACWEKRYIRKDGTPVWVSATVSTRCDAEGRPQHFIAVVEDIHARKAAEQQLAAAQVALLNSEARYRTAFRMNLDSVDICRLSDGMFIDVNDAFTRITGYTREEAIGRTAVELGIWPQPADRGRLLEAMMEGPVCRDMESEYRTKHGRSRWALLSVTAIELDGVPCILSISRDITEAKAAEERLAAAQDALRKSEERYRTAFETSIDCVNINRLDDGVYIEANRAFTTIMGYTREELIGHSSLEFDIWASTRDRQRLTDELRLNSVCRNLEAQFRRKDGSLLWGVMSASVLELDGVACILSVTRDISEAKASEQRLAAAREALRASEERYRTIFQTNPDPVVISRLADGMCVDVNQAFTDLSGYAPEDVVGKTTEEMEFWVDPIGRLRLAEALRRDASCRNLEAKFRKKDGEPVWCLISASIIELDGAPCILGVARDTSEAKEAEKNIFDLAYYDQLTRLPNRRHLLDLLRHPAGGHSLHRALLYIDLDNFKRLNDSMGHDAGDFLLQQVARRLLGCVRESDNVTRFGGDEFVVMLSSLSGDPEEAAAQAQLVGEKILAATDQPYMVGGHECHCPSSIGITVFGTTPPSASEVVQRAEMAMFKAKEAGGNVLRFFVPALQTEANARATLEEELRLALRHNQFELYYQPQVENGALIGAEALVRWNHPRRGLLLPGEFIALAEETGLILPLGDWVLETACAEIAAWANLKPAVNIPVAVNISASQFRQPGFVHRVLATLEGTGANPENLKLELTESMLLHNIEDVIATMCDLNSHRVRFSLDDFGTGYSSLSYLKRLPLDQLKIDRSFVRDILVDAGSGAIAQTVISLSKAMGLSVIAEGVETEEQRGFLATLGCHSFQGYLFSRPLPLAEFERLWLHASAGQPAA